MNVFRVCVLCDAVNFDGDVFRQVLRWASVRSGNQRDVGHCHAARCAVFDHRALHFNQRAARLQGAQKIKDCHAAGIHLLFRALADGQGVVARYVQDACTCRYWQFWRGVEMVDKAPVAPAFPCAVHLILTAKLDAQRADRDCVRIPRWLPPLEFVAGQFRFSCGNRVQQREPGRSERQIARARDGNVIACLARHARHQVGAVEAALRANRTFACVGERKTQQSGYSGSTDVMHIHCAATHAFNMCARGQLPAGATGDLDVNQAVLRAGVVAGNSQPPAARARLRQQPEIVGRALAAASDGDNMVARIGQYSVFREFHCITSFSK